MSSFTESRDHGTSEGFGFVSCGGASIQIGVRGGWRPLGGGEEKSGVKNLRQCNKDLNDKDLSGAKADSQITGVDGVSPKMRSVNGAQAPSTLRSGHPCTSTS